MGGNAVGGSNIHIIAYAHALRVCRNGCLYSNAIVRFVCILHSDLRCFDCAFTIGFEGGE